MVKKLFALLVVVALIFSLGACAKTATTDDGATTSETTTDSNKDAGTAKVELEETEITGEDDSVDYVAEIDALEGLDAQNVCFLVKTLVNPFFVAMEEGVKDAVRDIDTYTTVECQNDASVMLQQAESVANGGYDVCLLTIINSSDISIIQQMQEKGIMVILLDTLCVTDGLQYCAGSVVTDNYMAGYYDGEAFVKLLEEDGKTEATYAVFENPSGTVTAQRIQGFEDACAEATDVKIECVYRETGSGQIDAGLKFMENVLQVYNADTLDGVMSMNDPSAQGCANALKSAGYEPGEIYVFGVDGADETLEKIGEGYQTGTSLQYPGTMARAGLLIAYRQILGEEVPDDEKWLKISTTYID